jgi:hypothetical protein
MNTPQTTPIQADHRVWVNQKSPFIKDYSFYNIKKGTKVSFLNCYRNDEPTNCIFIKYEITELGTGMIIPFGPKNFKKAKQVTAIVEYTNIHNIKMRWRILKDGYTELIEVI